MLMKTESPSHAHQGEVDLAVQLVLLLQGDEDDSVVLLLQTFERLGHTVVVPGQAQIIARACPLQVGDVVPSCACHAEDGHTSQDIFRVLGWQVLSGS